MNRQMNRLVGAVSFAPASEELELHQDLSGKVKP